MKLRAQITIDIAAASYIEAAIQQKQLEKIAQIAKEDFPDAELTIRERRDRKLDSDTMAPSVRIVSIRKGQP